MKFGVVVFPGTNCEVETRYVIKDIAGEPAEFVWHGDKSLGEYGCLVLPGGFSYGDYLRTGAIARFSPVMQEIGRFPKKGGLVFGICNGFQILQEAGLLPGAMRRNKSLEFRCRTVHIRVENNETPFTNLFEVGDVLSMPIAHGEGNFYADEDTLQDLINNEQVIFRYCEPDGEVLPESNPNGSVYNIAGVCNGTFDVLGMMPHPERACEQLLGSEDGLRIFQSIINWGNDGKQKK